MTHYDDLIANAYPNKKGRKKGRKYRYANKLSIDRRQKSFPHTESVSEVHRYQLESFTDNGQDRPEGTEVMKSCEGEQ